MIYHSGLQEGDRLFVDPAYDGDPDVVFEPKPDEPAVPPNVDGPDGPGSLRMLESQNLRIEYQK